MALAIAILGILTPLAGLFVWWFKYKKDPTPSERVDQSNSQYEDSYNNITLLRKSGKQDEAEAMLARVRDATLDRWLLNRESSSLHPTPDKKRMGDDSTQRL